MGLENVSDQELQAELANRQKQRKERAAVEAVAMAERLTPAIVNFVAPTHLKSCSEERRVNGWYTEQDNGFRCARCALLETLDGLENGCVDLPAGFSYHVEVTARKFVE